MRYMQATPIIMKNTYTVTSLKFYSKVTTEVIAPGGNSACGIYYLLCLNKPYERL